MSRGRSIQKGTGTLDINAQILSSTSDNKTPLVIGAIDLLKIDIYPIPKEQLELISLLKYKNGESIINLGSVEKNVIYHISNLIDEHGFDKVYNNLRSKNYKDYNEFYFDQSAFDNAKLMVELELELHHAPPALINGMYKCGRCGSMKTVASSKQTRSLDEGESTKVKCQECGHGWGFNS
jgi:DNA-directed RNA polymerase subunit M/transcription elongation factor TFIIS